MIKYNSSIITIAFQLFSRCLFVRDDQLEVSLNETKVVNVFYWTTSVNQLKLSQILI